tara:strand:+ start:1372 stop:1698 length:327 start_codon:yes stop_codon:yes gene_type:complete
VRPGAIVGELDVFVEEMQVGGAIIPKTDLGEVCFAPLCLRITQWPLLQGYRWPYLSLMRCMIQKTGKRLKPSPFLAQILALDVNRCPTRTALNHQHNLCFSSHLGTQL